jgi:DNA-binding LytR/AlgR family response regulator
MKNILIIEDEKPAVEKIISLLDETEPRVKVVGISMSVKQSVKWLASHPMPDLILMDIALTDGSSFDIFKQVEITCPVIFMTAYDEYWQEAFAHNSIDYLLKPVKREKLAAALARYDKLKHHFKNQVVSLLQYTRDENDQFKKRFLVKRGNDLFSIKTEDIAYFYAAEKLVCMVDSKGQRFVLDQSLSELEKQLDPLEFNRVNRKFLIQKMAILRAKAYSKSKLLLEVTPPVSEDIIISQEQVARFKEWFGS